MAEGPYFQEPSGDPTPRSRSGGGHGTPRKGRKTVSRPYVPPATSTDPGPLRLPAARPGQSPSLQDPWPRRTGQHAGRLASWNPVDRPWIISLARVVRRGAIIGCVVAAGIWLRIASTGRPIDGVAALLILAVPVVIAGQLLTIGVVSGFREDLRRRKPNLSYAARQREVNRAVRSIMFGTTNVVVQVLVQLAFAVLFFLTFSGSAMVGGDGVEQQGPLDQQVASLAAFFVFTTQATLLTAVIRGARGTGTDGIPAPSS